MCGCGAALNGSATGGRRAQWRTRLLPDNTRGTSAGIARAIDAQAAIGTSLKRIISEPIAISVLLAFIKTLVIVVGGVHRRVRAGAEARHVARDRTAVGLAAETTGLRRVRVGPTGARLVGDAGAVAVGVVIAGGQRLAVVVAFRLAVVMHDSNR